MNDKTEFPDLNEMAWFVQVVDHAGFAPAGRALGMPKSKLSRRIAALEERLGVRLLNRSTRRFSVTEIGRIYYGHCKAMLVEAEAAQEAIDLRRAEARGLVRLACPVTLLDLRVAEMIAAFLVQHPRVEVQLEATNRRVDVVAEGFDIALRVRPPPLADSDLHVRVLSQHGQCLVASPTLVGTLGVPRVPADLAHWPSLDLGLAQGDHLWRLFGPDGAEAVIRHQPRLVTGGMSALRAAAVAGVGVVQLPLMVMRDQITAGELVPVIPDWAPRPAIVHAVFASRRGLLPAVRALIDHLVEGFRDIVEEIPVSPERSG